MSKKLPPSAPRTKKTYHVLLPASLAILALVFVSEPGGAQASLSGTEELPLPRSPYGATFDGTHFWTTDIQERRLIRLSPGGRSVSTYLGRGRIYGVDFNPADGHLYVGGEKLLLRVNPVTVGRTDTVPVPVARVAGVAFQGPLWYLLEKGTGTIHVYDPGLKRILNGLRTGRPELRDIAMRGSGLWASDGKSGLVFRYRPIDGVLTGSLRAPSSELRGLTFREGQMWIVDRNRRALVRLPYSETEYSIVSGEKRYEVTVEVAFSPTPESKGNLVLLLPMSTTTQQVTGVNIVSPGWQRGFTRTGRAVAWRTLASATQGSVRYTYRVSAQNARWYIPTGYVGPKENLTESAASGYLDAKDEDFNAGNPFDILGSLLPGGANARSDAAVVVPGGRTIAGGGGAGAAVAAFVANARRRDLPSRWTVTARLDSAGELTATRLLAEVYLRGPGWVPAESDPSDRRLFGLDATEIILFASPDGDVRGTGPLLSTQDPVGRGRTFSSVNSRTTLTILPRK